LIALGRSERTIRPDALVKYSDLLTCADVQRRAPPGADDPTLALYAHEALLAAIKSVTPAATRAIAEAALCSDERYEGRQIKERLPMLPGVSRSTFKERREDAFEQIIRYLTQPALRSHAVSTREINLDDEVGPPRSPRVPQLAATLHYFALLPLFEAQFNRLLRQHSLLQRIVYDTKLGPSFNRFIFDQYMALITLPSDTVHGELAHLPKATKRYVLQHMDNVRRSSPLGTRSISDQEATELTYYVSGVALDAIAAAAVDRLYETLWSSWYGLTCSGHSARQSALVPIVAATGAILSEFEKSSAEEATTIGVMRIDARRAAHKLAAIHYPLLDETVPIAGSLSLTQRLDAFIDIESADLTNVGEIWRLVGDKIWQFMHDGTPFQPRRHQLDE
jgi:hypothetical protein